MPPFPTLPLNYSLTVNVGSCGQMQPLVVRPSDSISARLKRHPTRSFRRSMLFASNNSDFFCAMVQAGPIYSLAYCCSLIPWYVLEIAGYPHSLLREFEGHRASQACYKSGVMSLEYHIAVPRPQLVHLVLPASLTGASMYCEALASCLRVADNPPLKIRGVRGVMKEAPIHRGDVAISAGAGGNRPEVRA
jgi:hypothetical protein